MRAFIAAVVGSALLGLIAGCGHAEQQRQAQEYESFLKDALGTVEIDAAPPQQHAQAATHAVD
jgi:hypothetical protein